MDKIALLKDTQIFSSLTDNVLDLIARDMERLEISEGEIIFEEGAVADSFYIIEEGEVIISKKIQKGRDKILSILKSGGVFGEMAFFSEQPRTASAQCGSTRCVLWRVCRDKFFDVVEKHPAQGLKIFSRLLEVSMERLDKTSRELATIYETGKIISTSNSLSEISVSVAEELLVSFPRNELAHAAIFFYNEFNEDFENPSYHSVAADTSFIRILSELIGQNKGLIYPHNNDNEQKISSITKKEISAEVPFLENAAMFIAVPIAKRVDKSIFPLSGFIALWLEDTADENDKKYFFQWCDILLLISVAGQLSEAFELLLRRQEDLNRARLKSDLPPKGI